MNRIFRRAAAFICAAVMLATPVSALSVEQARTLLEEYYLNELPAEAESAQTLDELFSYISDPYTYYMTAKQYEAFLSGVEGESSVTGVGAGISFTADGILLLSILPGSSAEEVGLVPGDLIVAIEGASCVPANEAHRDLLVGEAGSRVSFTVRHENGTLQIYTVTRRTAAITNTVVSAKDGIGYIDCDTFGSQTAQHFTDGIEKYDDAVHHWIVDLRSNSGGLSSAAIDTLGLFVGSGALLYFKDRADNVYVNYHWGSPLTQSPAIVLTNAYSASSAEVLAGGLSRCGGGIAVGSRSYGKGVAQQLYDQNASPFFNGDALKITTYRLYCADGNTTDMIGVIPTLVVPDEQTEAVAKLLCGEKPTDGGEYFRLTLNGYHFYIRHKTADPETLRALLDALAPDAALYFGSGGSEIAVEPDFARTICGGAAGREFPDVSGSVYANEINTLAVYQILFGDSGGFRASDTMTRAEVCALLAHTLNVGMNGSGFFSDVPDGKWYAPCVNAMAALGLVDGVGGGKFDPNGTMTQEQFLSVMGRLAVFLNLEAGQFSALCEGIELPEKYDAFSAWARPDLLLMNEGMTDETGESVSMLFTELEKVSPKAPILREQAAAALYRTLTTLGVLSY